jgi:hypothetical protein
MTICAIFTDPDSASACGLTVTGTAPVLDLCRALLQAGHDPGKRLEVYRGSTLCLIVRSIGEGARLRLSTNKKGSPRLRKIPQPRMAAASSMHIALSESDRRRCCMQRSSTGATGTNCGHGGISTKRHEYGNGSG